MPKVKRSRKHRRGRRGRGDIKMPVYWFGGTEASLRGRGDMRLAVMPRDWFGGTEASLPPKYLQGKGRKRRKGGAAGLGLGANGGNLGVLAALPR